MDKVREDGCQPPVTAYFGTVSACPPAGRLIKEGEMTPCTAALWRAPKIFSLYNLI